MNKTLSCFLLEWFLFFWFFSSLQNTSAACELKNFHYHDYSPVGNYMFKVNNRNTTKGVKYVQR